MRRTGTLRGAQTLAIFGRCSLDNDRCDIGVGLARVPRFLVGNGVIDRGRGGILGGIS